MTTMLLLTVFRLVIPLALLLVMGEWLHKHSGTHTPRK
jgi:hypothetical protein